MYIRYKPLKNYVMSINCSHSFSRKCTNFQLVCLQEIQGTCSFILIMGHFILVKVRVVRRRMGMLSLPSDHIGLACSMSPKCFFSQLK